MINLKKSLLLFFLLGSIVCPMFADENVAIDAGTEQYEEASSIEEEFIISDKNEPIKSDNSKKEQRMNPILKMIIVLVIVVALIFVVFYFIKKKTNFVKNDDDYLRRAAYINIAPGKTVEVITLIDKAYLIGVTEDNITLLGEIDDDELIKAMNITSDKKNNTKKASTFSEVLDMFLVKGNKKKNVFSDTESKIENMGNTEELDGEK